MALAPCPWDGDEAENTRLIHRALDLGINFFDTADLYEKGENEKKIGQDAEREKREQALLATPKWGINYAVTAADGIGIHENNIF